MIAYIFIGVKELSPLRWLPLFCLVWDIMPDMMHLIPGIWSRHFLHMLTGARYPAEVKARKKNTAAENRALAADAKACRTMLDTWALDKVHLVIVQPFVCMADRLSNVSTR